MDRICRRQIGARPFLRTAQYAIFHKWNSNSVGCGGGERGKRHGFNVGYIHGTATGNLFLLVHGNGEFSRIIISCLVRSFSLFERGSDRVGLCWRCKHVADQETPLTVQSTLNLKSGDQIWAAIDYGHLEASLIDYYNAHYTHFTGFMLEEDIVASLWWFCFD